MRAILVISLILTLCSSLWADCSLKNNLPDPQCTKGSVFPNITKETLCTPGYSKTVRDVSSAKKKQIYKDYGIDPRKYKCKFGIDHLVSLQLGGDNADTNLFPLPQPVKGEKDKIENALRRAICNDEISIEEAQKAIARNWQAMYYKMKLAHLKKLNGELWSDWQSYCPAK